MKTKLESISTELRKTTNQLEEKENLSNPELINRLRELNRALIEYEDIRDPSPKVKRRCARETCER